MALKDTWVDKKNTTDGNDGDYIVVEDINAIANAVIDLEEHNDNKEFYTKDETDALLGGKADKSNVYTQTETNARISQSRVEVENYISNIIQTMVTMVQGKLDKKANADNVYTKSEIDNKIGSIDTALDELHAYAQALIGGEA